MSGGRNSLLKPRPFGGYGIGLTLEHASGRKTGTGRVTNFGKKNDKETEKSELTQPEVWRWPQASEAGPWGTLITKILRKPLVGGQCSRPQERHLDWPFSAHTIKGKQQALTKTNVWW